MCSLALWVREGTSLARCVTWDYIRNHCLGSQNLDRDYTKGREIKVTFFDCVLFLKRFVGSLSWRTSCLTYNRRLLECLCVLKMLQVHKAFCNLQRSNCRTVHHNLWIYNSHIFPLPGRALALCSMQQWPISLVQTPRLLGRMDSWLVGRVVYPGHKVRGRNGRSADLCAWRRRRVEARGTADRVHRYARPPYGSPRFRWCDFPGEYDMHMYDCFFLELWHRKRSGRAITFFTMEMRLSV